MATPAIRLLYDRLHEEASLTVLGRPYIMDLYDGLPWFENRIVFYQKSLNVEHHQCQVIRQLRRERFDNAILFPNSFRTAWMAWWGGIRGRLGFSKSERSLLLTTSVPKPDREIPLVEYYLVLVETLLRELKPEDPPCEPTKGRLRMELRTTPEEEKLGDEIWSNLGLRSPDRVLMLNVSSSNSAVKNWPIDHATQFSRLVVDRLDYDVLINCGPGELEMARQIVRDSQRDRVFSLADQPLNIHAGKICLKRARLTVSADSGPLHIASAFGNPTVVLLGPTSETYIFNPEIERVVLSRHLDCAPCHAKTRCPKKHLRCMLEITPEIVLDSVVEILSSNSEHETSTNV